MHHADLQSVCELGQRQLMAMEYIDAEQTLAAAENQAWGARDFDTLSRLYMPLQEARRQRRQRCGEGIVRLDLIAHGTDDAVDGQRIVENFPHGQLLVAGWGTIAPAVTARQLGRERKLYVETFLAAVYPTDTGYAVVIVPTDDSRLPDVALRRREELTARLPPRCLVLSAGDFPSGARKGDTGTFAQVSAMWERLNAPFLADAQSPSLDPLQRLQACRAAIAVDYACELAHQYASAAAREMARR